MPFLLSPYRFATGGGSLTDPSDIASCKVWCESDVGLFSDSAGTTPQSTNGGTVRYWTNQMGANPFSRTIAAGSAPTLDTGTTINGHPSLQFTAGTLQCLTLPDILTGDGSGEMLMVVKKDNDPEGAPEDTGFIFFGNSVNASHYPFTDGVVYDAFGTDIRKTVGNVAPNLAAWHVYNPWSAPSDWNLNINGASVFSTGTNTMGWATIPILGISSGSGGYTGSKMRVAAVYHFGAKLSGPERAFMYAWILAKYGI